MMKKAILTVLLTLLTALAVVAQPTAPRGKTWKAVEQLTDEFDTWDGTKWFKSLWNYGVPVQMRAENSGVADGKLWIKATLDQGAERWFQTSRVMSRTKVKFPMYIECSMRTAHISAYNTFWTNNGDISDRDEIDICENNSKPSIVADQSTRPWTMYSQYFVVNDDVTEREHANFDNRGLDRTNPLKGVAWNEAYHTLGMWWKDEHTVQFYLNGETAGLAETVKPFTLEQSVIWDLWTIDASWSGGIAAQSDLLVDSINTMYVDWVHTYTLEDASTSIAETSLSAFANVYVRGADRSLQFRLQSEASSFQVEVYNNYGQLVMQQSVDGTAAAMPMHQLASGIYHVKLKSAGQYYSQTVVLP